MFIARFPLSQYSWVGAAECGQYVHTQLLSDKIFDQEVLWLLDIFPMASVEDVGAFTSQ